jgi:hypothetical protein
VFHLGDQIEIRKMPARAEFQVRVTGAASFRHCIVELEDHWRVDTHAFPEEPPPREPHPFIHFQRGGHAQDAFSGKPNFVPGHDLPAKQDDLWRSLLQSPSPRIPFPPLCPLLAIDFAIGQHDGTVWQQLRARPEYLTVIQSAQARLWDPFFSALAEPTVRRRWIGPLLA